MRRLLFSSTLLSLLGLFQSAAAQDVAYERALPDSIVVTASRTPEAAHRAGHVVEVITAAEIRALPVRSLDELLHAVGGVEVLSRGGLGAQSDLTLRGASFNSTVLLLDGARLNDSMTGHFLTDLPLPLAEVARVEVLRGPAAALYGPDAIGGVIHLITYTGLAEQGQMLLLSGQLGEYDTRDGEIAARRGGDRLSLSLAEQQTRTDGEPVLDIAGAPITGSLGAVQTDFDRAARTAALNARLGDDRALFRVGYDEREFGAFQFYTPFASDTAREATRTFWAQGRYAAGPERLGLDQLEAHLTFRRHEDRYRYYPGLLNEHTSYRTAATLAGQKRISPAVRLGAGLSGEWRAIDSNNLGQHDDAAGGLYTSAQWDAAPGLVLTTTARADYDAAYGFEPTATLAASYAASQMLRLRAVAGRAVRAPTYVDRYFSTEAVRPSGNLGNPDLAAERAWNVELGYDLAPLPGVLLRAAGFWRQTDDLIDYVRTPIVLGGDSTEVFLAQNVLQATTRGLELDAEGRRTVGPLQVTTRASYTWLDTDLDTDRALEDLKYALSHSRRHLRGSVTARLSGASLGVQAFWKERLDGEAYGVVHARAGYALPLAPLGPGGRMGLHVEMQNVLDEQYAEVFGAPMPGRRWLVGARLMLGR